MPLLSFNARMQLLANRIYDLNLYVFELQETLNAFEAHPVEEEIRLVCEAMLATREALHALLFPGAPPTTAAVFHVEQLPLLERKDQ